MAYIVEIVISSPLANYEDVAAFEAGVRGAADPDVDALINSELVSGDLELHNVVFEEDMSNYVSTSTFTWKDEASYLTHTADETIQDNQTALEVAFTFVRNLP